MNEIQNATLEADLERPVDEVKPAAVEPAGTEPETAKVDLKQNVALAPDRDLPVDAPKPAPGSKRSAKRDLPGPDRTVLTTVLSMEQVPETVRKRLLVGEKKAGEYFFRDRDQRIAFVDQGKKLSSKEEDPMVIHSMVAIARAKGWSAVSVKGTEAFRREAWLQASMAGLRVKGHAPDGADLARLAEAKRSGLTNVMTVADPEASGARESASRTSATDTAVKVAANDAPGADARLVGDVNPDKPGDCAQALVYAAVCRAKGMPEASVQKVIVATNELSRQLTALGVEMPAAKVYDPSAPALGARLRTTFTKAVDIVRERVMPPRTVRR